ncbi:MAG: lasso peptide biosynthesis B2 protein [Lysobacter sp.]|nr:lasso peptide biosynthesis B2 protein [Lysobacter sp.]
MPASVASLRRLSWRRCIALGLALRWLLMARAGLRHRPLSDLLRQMEGARALPGAYGVDEAVWAVCAVARRVPGTACLARSLALQGVLRSAGIASELRIGVAKDVPEGLAAHAWVVCEGRVLPTGDEPSGYTPLPPFRT